MNHKVSQIYISLKRKAQSPLVWGILFFALIFLFSAVFFILPRGTFSKPLISYLDALYFSVETITTLGFGDINAISVIGKILVIAESLFGVLTVGLFLNSIAHSQAVIDSNKADDIRKQEAYKQDLAALQRANTFIQLHLNNYEKYLAILSNPMEGRGLKLGEKEKQFVFKSDFSLHDLKDLYQPTLLLTCDFKKCAVEYYFDSLHRLIDSLKLTILNVNLHRWSELLGNIESFIKTCDDTDFEEFILSLKHDKTMCDLIAKYNGDYTYQISNSFNPYLALYHQMKAGNAFIQRYKSVLNTILSK